MKRNEMKNQSGSISYAQEPTDLLAQYDKELRYCNLCPRLCHHSCPVSNAERDESVTPAHKNILAGLVSRGEEALDEGISDIFYKCLGCGLCTEVCQHDNDVAMSLISARALAIHFGLEAPALSDLRKSFERFGNAWLEVLTPRLRDSVPAAKLIIGEVSKIAARPLRIYWPGCAALARNPELVSLSMRVFTELGQDDIRVYCGDKAQCCGYPLLAAGQRQAFVEHAKRASSVLAGGDVIYTAAPECAWTFSVAWPKIAGVEPPAKNVTHVVELLASSFGRGSLRGKLDIEAVYHDPCYLGRKLGFYEEPRKILKSILKKAIIEVESWNREESYCCGAGGELETTSPDTARLITKTRLEQLLGDAGESRHVITACPRCSTRFKEEGARSLDIVEVLGRYLSVDKENSQMPPKKKRDGHPKIEGFSTFLVVNPESGGRSTGRRIREIRRYVRGAVGEFDYEFTTGIGHAVELARKAIEAGYEMVVAVGGDGTFSEVVSGFFENGDPINPEAVFGLIPAGTGGDFRRSLGMSKDMGDACRALGGRNTRLLDVGYISYVDHAGEEASRAFINVASLGLGGAVVDRVNKSSKVFGGRVSFTIGSIRTLLEYEDVKISVSFDDEAPITLPVTCLAVCNGQFFGGGMRIAPNAVLDDGLFDITSWSGIKLRDFAFKTRAIYDGTHIRDHRTTTRRARMVKADSDERVLIDVDGEQPGVLPATITILPRALRVKVL